MREYVVNRPDAGAMRTLLEGESDPEGLIVRLAWLAGLSRDEIAVLCWEQVSFMDERLELPDRTIPLAEELRSYLWRVYQNRKNESPYVVVSERYGDRMQPESISRLARQALDRSGQKHVRLMDLRHDWIIHQLETEDWPTVARLSGVEVPALQARFSKFVTWEKPQSKSADEGRVDEFKLWKVLQAEKRSPAGLALWLAWQMGLQAREIAALTWEQVDFESGVIWLDQREEPLTNAVRRLLWEERESRPPQADPHVLLTEQSHKPLDLPRLSRLTRAALIRGGLEHVHLMDLRRDERRQSGDTALLESRSRSSFPRRGHGTAGLVPDCGVCPAAPPDGRAPADPDRREILSARYCGAAGRTARSRTELSGAGGLCVPAGNCPAAACTAQAMHLNSQTDGDLRTDRKARTKVSASGAKGGITYIKAPPEFGGAFCFKIPMLPFAYK